MEEITKEFNQGFDLLNSKDYESAISLFQQDLGQNPDNFASYNNIGLSQTYLRIDIRDKVLIESAIQHFKKAIAIADELNYQNGYPIAEVNLKWAFDELSKL
jgi:tetratricopeptide (TPR) repeat protein